MKSVVQPRYYRVCWTSQDGERVEGIWLPLVVPKKIIEEAIGYMNNHTPTVYRVEYKGIASDGEEQ